MIKLTIISFSFVRGGAAKAASRFSFIAEKFSALKILSVEESPHRWGRRWHFVKRLISYPLAYYFFRNTGVKCSFNFFSFGPALKFIGDNDSAICNIHWINNDTISIFKLKSIPYASIITLHDEWLYCSFEHCLDITQSFEFSPYNISNSVYRKKNLSYLRFFIWNVKTKAFNGRNDLVVTCPSTWLAHRARSSHVLKDCDIRVLHNPIDTSVFTPLDAEENIINRRALGLDGRWLVVFGYFGGGSNDLKGFDELYKAFQLLSKKPEMTKKIVIGLFGAEKVGIKELNGFPVHEFGFIESEVDLAKLYSVAHVTVVASKVESFGQVAAESLSCETPVISFDTSGLKDVVVDGITGFVAESFSPVSLAEKIELLLSLPSQKYEQLCKGARKHVLKHFCNDVISEQYESIVNEQRLKKRRAR